MQTTWIRIEIQSFGIDSLSQFIQGVYYKIEFINFRNDVNRTEIIYSVLVNAKPVVAVTAAADMKWVSVPEVTELMGREVYTKAERKFIVLLTMDIC